MNTQSSNKKIWIYIREHWFKIILAGLVIFVFLKKDFSFNFNLNSPTELNQKEILPEGKKVKVSTTAKGEITQKVSPKSSGILEKFGFASLFSSGSSKKKNKLDLGHIDETTKIAYLKRFGHVAVSERKKFGIPASIILANGLIHSQAGQSEAAKESNSHFGIICSRNWAGAEGHHNGKCYRAYESAWMSFRNHSEYLTTDKFESLKSNNSKDYKAWAKGLEKNGFSEYDNYSKHLIDIIEKYQLQELDES